MYKLVIVDDEEKIVEGIAQLFPWEQIGFEVVAWFQKGKEVLQYVKSHPVDLVMSDIEMPDINGLELSKELKRVSNVKIVLFSSYQNYEYFRSAIQYQVCDYLLKPIRYNELLECMEKVKKELHNSKADKLPLDLKDHSYYGKVIQKVQTYIEDHVKDATLDGAAEVVNLSPTYLSKIFKEKSGIGFSEYLLKVRMEKACEMLQDIQYKSYDIAYYVGYDNPKNFSRAFKSYYHITPNEYRNGNASKKN